MDFTYERIRVICEQLEKWMVKEDQYIHGFMYKDCGYKSGNAMPKVDNSWLEIKKGERWGGKKDTHRWFYKKLDMPALLPGQETELRVLTGQEGQWDSQNPQFIVYMDGKIVQAMDINHTTVTLTETGEHELYLYAYAGMFDKFLEFIPTLRVIDSAAKTLYYHLKTPFDVASYLEPAEKQYIDIMTHLNNAVNLLDLREPGSEEYDQSVLAAIAYMEQEFYGKYCKEQEVTTICIGHTHIDVAWLWTLQQTREKAQRSFANVVKLMKQYPEYKFMSSQAKLYAYVKEEDPVLYEEIKELVKEGRWEVEGGMWLEADCNLPSGESLVRQILFGKRFFKEEFGVENRVLWLPDVFGYSAALPQILRKAGIDRFVTSKISWNETNQMPYDTFMWEGIDGTEIFSYFLTAQDKERGKKPGDYTTYVAFTRPSMIAGSWDRYHQKALNNETLLTFGYGDGGGGPTAGMLETARRLEHGIPGCPQVKIDTATNFLNRLVDKVSGDRRLPKWVGELYLEFHRGTYTSIAKNKKNNRRSEFLYQNAEWISSVDKLLCGGEYPQEKLNKGWEKILTRQFHDIIPGSSIGEVYDECDVTYGKVLKAGNDVVEEKMAEIAGNIHTDGGVLVFNPNSFESAGLVEVDGRRMYAAGVPARGYKVIPETYSETEVVIGDRFMENLFFILRFNENYEIISLYDKRNRREVIKEKERANVLQVFEDFPRKYDAWEISEYYKEKMWEIQDVTSVETVDEGARAGIRITRTYRKSVITQTIWMYNDIDRIDFQTHADWHEEHVLLKTAFPVDVHSDKATYEIQFGNVERPTHRNTSWDAAKFEVCAHKYVDLSEYGYGVSLLNDCKYGHDILGSTMRLTLLKCATYPYQDADKGEHDFTYSIYPHSGDWREADTIRHAFDLNNPLRGVKIGAKDGTLPEEYSLVNTDARNVIVDTVKKAEDSEDLIIRMYECYNKKTETTVTFGFDVERAAVCSLMEEEERELEVIDNKVQLVLKPYELVTLKAVKK